MILTDTFTDPVLGDEIGVFYSPETQLAFARVIGGPRNGQLVGNEEALAACARRLHDYFQFMCRVETQADAIAEMTKRFRFEEQDALGTLLASESSLEEGS